MTHKILHQPIHIKTGNTAEPVLIIVSQRATGEFWVHVAGGILCNGDDCRSHDRLDKALADAYGEVEFIETHQEDYE